MYLSFSQIQSTLYKWAIQVDGKIEIEIFIKIFTCILVVNVCTCSIYKYQIILYK